MTLQGGNNEPWAEEVGTISDEDFDVDSLFDSTSPLISHLPTLSKEIEHAPPALVAQRTSPPIPGLFFDPSILITEELSNSLIKETSKYFILDGRAASGRVNQAMLFGRASGQGSGLPRFLDDLIPALASLLRPHLPDYIHKILFPSSISSTARQAILNYYAPGEGITPHVDLLERFADGIVAVSLGSGTVMTFVHVNEEGTQEAEGDKGWDIYLPERSVLVLTGDARYKWMHGIEGRLKDYVSDQGEIEHIERGDRVSITLRWLLPGADVVGTQE